MSKKTLLLISLLVLILISIVNGQELVDKFYKRAESSYYKQDLQTAYKSINFVLNYYANQGSIPANARVLAQKICYSYLSKNMNDKEVTDSIQYVLNKYPSIANSSINRLLTQIKKKQEAEQRKQELETRLKQERMIEEQRQAELKAEQDAYEQELELLEKKREVAEKQAQADLKMKIEELRMMAEQRMAQQEKERQEFLDREARLIEERNEMERRARSDLKEMVESTLQAQSQSTDSANKIGVTIIVFVAILGVFIFIGLFAIIFLFIKNSQQQQKSFEYTMSSVMTLAPARFQALPDVTNSVAENFALEGETGSQMRALPFSDQTNQDDKQLRQILEICKSYSKQIDEVTNRKNLSRNVAELVYKISEEMGFSKQEAAIHYSIGLVYDIGFINLDPSLFSNEQLTEEEFRLLKTHTKTGTHLIHFIKDEELRSLFAMAILKHHENLDGSGYPQGIKEDEIPFIARVIRVIESYLSMVSSRSYNTIKDRESAIQELLSKSNIYDSSIVKALNDVL